MDQHLDSPDALILELDSPEASLAAVGGKGASLARLASAGLPVPPGFHITTHAYHIFVEENHLTGSIVAAARSANAGDPSSLDEASSQIRRLFEQGRIPGSLAEMIHRWYRRLGSGDLPVAVRSSATAEDLPEASFAGQQETYLNVRGEADVLEAVKRCWASLWTARAIGYRARQGIPPDEVSLAVVVQALVPADAAGILFTANPLTGDTAQVVINAAWGLGEAVVGGLVTPDIYVVEKATGRLLDSQVVDKQVMTVRVDGGTREQPVPESLRQAAVLEEAASGELARLGVQIETLYGTPMDIEWAREEGQFYILQARPVTALPEARPTLDWSLPRAGGMYWRASVIELLPDPLSPLFATLALPEWNQAYHRLFGSLGDARTFERVFPKQLLLTINEYAYYDYGFTAGQYARFGLGMLRYSTPLFGWLQRAHARWADEARPAYAAVMSRWAGRDLPDLPTVQMLQGVREITSAAAAHYLTIQSGIIPIATLSEAVFTAVYNRLIKRKSDPPALTFLLGFDSAPIQSEKSLYDLAAWAAQQPDLSAYLRQASSADIAAAVRSGSAPIQDMQAWMEFCGGFTEHLQRFGHAIYDLDFAKSIPADDPAPLLDTLKYFLTGQARNPYERQGRDIEERERAVQSLQSRLRGIRRRWFTKLVGWAQHFAPLREDALADVGLGWPVLRRLVHEIGRRLAEAGVLSDPGEIYWLKGEEVQAAAHRLDASDLPGDAGQALPDYRPVAAERRQRWERLRKVTPPVTLPLKGGGRFLGIDFSRWMPARTGQEQGTRIKGTGASPGQVSGTARVIHDPGEFSTMQPGDILVAKITTPAWTPLFALASGVVTDVGGPLSHSSIVAREYHIPAVLGTGVATERIHSGQRITVDGDEGVVTWSD